MIVIPKMKADCRPPISRRKGIKSDKTQTVSPNVQMATPAFAKVSSKKSNRSSSSAASLKEKENNETIDKFDELKLSKDTEIKYLKDILLNNLNLVEQQEKLLVTREKEIVQLKKENETLRCRLERMDRRVSLMKSGAVSTPVSSPLTPSKQEEPPKAVKRKSTLEPQSLAKKFATIARKEYEKDQMKVRLPTSDTNDTPEKRTPRKHHQVSRLKRRSLKQRLSANFDSTPPPKGLDSSADARNLRHRQTSTPQKTTCESSAPRDNADSIKPVQYPTSSKKPKIGGVIRTPKRVRRRVRIPKDDTILKTNIEYYVPQEQVVPEANPKKPEKKAEEVLVPSFRIKTYTPYYVIDGRENFEDEVYIERHKKPENEEKKRKRWDLQQQREEEQRRKLLSSQRYQKQTLIDPKASKIEKNNNTEFTSLIPDPSNIEYIEVCDELPVSVFGYPLPTVDSEKEFSLPWFDMEKREREEVKKTRARKR